jgi:hypothetical protein
MTDTIAVKPTRLDPTLSWDLYRKNGTCTSGYHHKPEYDGLRSALRWLTDASIKDDQWCSIKEWGAHYTVVGTIHLFRWEYASD